ncbi:hypothetical protein M3J09_006242 [Ascochyta lentis]
MQEPYDTSNYAASVFKVFGYCNPGDITKLRSSLEDKDETIEQRDQLIKEQRDLIKGLETGTDRLSALHKFEQEHRHHYESQVLDLTQKVEEHKAALIRHKSVFELQDLSRTQQKQINDLQDENRQLKFSEERYLCNIKVLKDRVSQGEKQISGLRDERAYLETHNLGLRDELVAKELHYHHEIEETANHYKSKLGPYERVIQVLHALFQQGGEELCVAVYFAHALKLSGLQLHTVGIDEFVWNGQNLYSTSQPLTFERDFYCNYRQNLLAAPVLSSDNPPAFGPTSVAPALDAQQQAFAPDQSLKGGQTDQFGASSGVDNGAPLPPFPIEIMDNRIDYKNMDSPFAVDCCGEYLDEKEAEKARNSIEKWKKNFEAWEKKRKVAQNQQAQGQQQERQQQQPSSFASPGPAPDPMDITMSNAPTFTYPPQPFTTPSPFNQLQGSFGQPSQQTAQPGAFGQPQQSWNSLPSLFPASNQGQVPNQTTALFGMPILQQNWNNGPAMNYRVSRVDDDEEML